MRAGSAVTWPETGEVLISQSRLQTLRFGTRITNHPKPLRVDNRFSCWNWLRLCVCNGCNTTWYNNFFDFSSDGQKVSSERSWWLSTGQHRKAAEHRIHSQIICCSLLSVWRFWWSTISLWPAHFGQVNIRRWKLDLFNLKWVKMGHHCKNLEYTAKSLWSPNYS